MSWADEFFELTQRLGADAAHAEMIRRVESDPEPASQTQTTEDFIMELFAVDDIPCCVDTARHPGKQSRTR
ncbi:hypothetical protein ACFXAZ_20125 [Streptomyces sp. NPDC059477]|uniref:hypothetical protein n=1 Tax=Streptomyces sp. NPDC059477 TaxID=3346847 RepID=UPI0036AB3EDB